jgi:hypothetical protein
MITSVGNDNNPGEVSSVPKIGAVKSMRDASRVVFLTNIEYSCCF